MCPGGTLPTPLEPKGSCPRKRGHLAMVGPGPGEGSWSRRACFTPLARRGGFAAAPLASPAPSWRFRGSALFGRFRTEPIAIAPPKGRDRAEPIRPVRHPRAYSQGTEIPGNRSPGPADAATWARHSRRERAHPRACPSRRRRRTPERVAPWPRSRLPNNDDMIPCETAPPPPKNTASTLSRKESMRPAQGLAQAGIRFYLKFPVEENRVVLHALRDLSTSPCTDGAGPHPGLTQDQRISSQSRLRRMAQLMIPTWE